MFAHSPHFVFWVGKKNTKLQNTFWKELNEAVENNFIFDDIHIVDKYTNLMKNIIEQNDFNKISMYKNNLYIVDVNQKVNTIENIRGKNGTFFQKNINNNDRISISADISVLAKASKNLEHLTPPFAEWKKFNK